MKTMVMSNEVQGNKMVANDVVELSTAMPEATATTPKATDDFETISVPGSESPVYAELLKHETANSNEEYFYNHLKKAISGSVKTFEVFVCDPSLIDGKLQFKPGFKPAINLTYTEMENLATENDIRLGEPDEYILFLAFLLDNLIHEEGWTEAEA